MFKSYEDAYRRSLEDREGFWSIAAGAIHWEKKWDKVLDDSKAPFYRWFVGGKMNTCYNAIDIHVENGRKDQTAIIYDSPVTNTKQKITYGELLNKVADFAGALKSLGVEKGDRVVIYMPMIPEAAVAMFACARIGAIHSLVFGGFASNELAVRIEDAKPKIVLSASCGIEPKGAIPYKPLLDKAIELSRHKPEKCVIYQRPQVQADLIPGRDIDWVDALKGVSPAPCVTVEATDPLYILYTSGTTGIPKGVVRDNGGHAVALKWSMKHIYGVEPGDVYWAASDVGWVVGHSYIIYAPLLSGCTTIMFEGKPVGTPDPGAFWRVISEYGVKVLFTAPTAFRAIKKEDPSGKYLEKYDISCLKYLFLAGERLDPDTYHWASDLLRIPVVDHWWQTETGWAIAANCMGIEELPIKPGSPTKPVPGYDVRILSESGKERPNGDEGVIGIRLPLPPGCLPTLWQKDDGFVKSYLSDYPGYYATGDGGYKDKDGYLYIMGRVDDVINVAGHRLSTGGMEEVVAKHPDVAECAVIGVEDQLKGQVPVGFVVLKAGSAKTEKDIQKEVVAMVRAEIGALACLKDVAVVKRLPKTRSGKILRGTMRKIADGEKFTTPSTIEDPAVLGEIEAALRDFGYPKG
ncbi:MAG: Acetyl-coenzyme A synthetase [Deltaproteobacteria bacterium ADurb.BinA179]|jgi:propionyl-CoA synthetase|nr:propionyl-CoA synthetase [Deltaproteobacteria bacterium]MDI9542379.1 propionyl-CoA synthetase [Pseudomonadota bacterium]NLW68731.1 propionyl-CoA synthetase [Bacteriovoracaceae bacterium]OPZ25632.1 MAG: Acetyl-coenzyme A synthetase [Deltaproteobacteria bacterium ADurb.BinA179]HRR20114.1 propionyl-CoA synthetase [Desulfomonilia bacterium]